MKIEAIAGNGYLDLLGPRPVLLQVAGDFLSWHPRHVLNFPIRVWFVLLSRA